MARITARLLCLIGLLALASLLSACNLTGAPREAPTSEAETPEATSATLSPDETLTSATGTPGAAVTSTPNVTATSATALNAQAGNETPANSNAVIDVPADGSVVSGTPLAISGSVRGLSEDRFWLELLDDQGNTINRQEITLRNPNGALRVNWSASLFTRYTGAAELRLIARDRNGRDYVGATVHITIGEGGDSASLQTTSAPVATIASPAAGSTVSGESIQIGGTAGGLFEATFSLELLASDGTPLTTQVITLTSSDPSFVVPWSAVIDAGGYRGSAEIRATYQRASDGQTVTLDSVNITLN
ncbi:MAG: hypothetical protein IT320_01950 [Anaerolineae bacterium]|nr:hypothetical protein [Anaerolineae bacterium]